LKCAVGDETADTADAGETLLSWREYT